MKKLLFTFLVCIMFIFSLGKISSKEEIVPKENESLPVLAEMQDVSNLLINMRKIILKNNEFFSNKTISSMSYIADKKNDMNFNPDDKKKIDDSLKRNGKVFLIYFITSRKHGSIVLGGDASYYFDIKTGDLLVKKWGK